MANTVAYPDLALEKIIGIDSSEDPIAFIRLIEKKISFSLGSRPATKENNVPTVYDHRRKSLFRSVSRGSVAEWFDSLQATIIWESIKTHWLKDNISTTAYQFFMTNGPSWMDTTVNSPAKNNSCHSTPEALTSSPDFGIPHSSPHTRLSFQPD